MARQLDPELKRFSGVEILRSQALGAGSYGAVYRAKWNQQMCAAKLPHPLLLEGGNHKAKLYLKQFKKECELLGSFRHDNVVQFLGTCTDSHSGQPALLMELMDQNLTNFLKHSNKPLPYYLEVDLCHDVAQALEYLHSNRITHRDLSSNNVLLTTNLKAKVSDFGMSKVIDAALEMTSTLTLCPGNILYMPPEALASPPVYTEKMDCFSFGVLAIQIMCRQFPDPGLKEQTLVDPRSPVGKCKVPILEAERRKAHIDLIEPDHPLLGTATVCLSHREYDRPSSRELCEAILHQKESDRYTRSHSPHQGTVSEDKMQLVASLKREVHCLMQKLRTQTDELAALKQEGKRAKEEIASLKKQLAGKDRTLEAREQELIESKEKVLQELSVRLESSEVYSERQQFSLQLQSSIPLQVMSLTWKVGKKAPCLMSRGSTTVNGKMVYFMPAESNCIYAYDSEGEIWWSPLPECPNTGSALVVIRGLVTAIGGKQLSNSTTTLQSLTTFDEGRRWFECFPRMPFAIGDITAVSGEGMLIVVGDDVRVVIFDIERLQWSTVAVHLPHPVPNASVALSEGNVYILCKMSVLVCSLSEVFQSSHGRTTATRLKKKMFSRERSQGRMWQRVSDLPVSRATCATPCGQLVAVGGKDGWEDKPCASVYAYNSTTNQWVVVGDMPTARAMPLVVVLHGNEIMVVGGEVYGMGQRSHDTGMTAYQWELVDSVEIAKCTSQTFQ